MGDRGGKWWRQKAYSVHCTCILAGSVHGCHPRALLTAGSLLHSVEYEVGQGHLMVAEQHILINVIIHQHLLCTGVGGWVISQH